VRSGPGEARTILLLYIISARPSVYSKQSLMVRTFQRNTRQQETGEKPSLSSVLIDAPWLNRRRPGSLYSIVEYE
jgi:hypothetical protein